MPNSRYFNVSKEVIKNRLLELKLLEIGDSEPKIIRDVIRDGYFSR